MRIMLRLVGLLVFLVAGTADATVLCAKRRADGTIAGTVHARAACRTTEALLTPEEVGFCCPGTTSTTITSTTIVCPTSTTLGAPPCGPQNPGCLGVCPGGQTCADIGGGTCGCTGTATCGFAGYCGGACPTGQTCEFDPVPPGCQPVDCSCR